MTLGSVKSRTVLVLDCSEQCADGFYGNEVSLSLKGGSRFIANKTTLTACVEGMSEYCRIVYDLFPDSHFVSVVASGDKPFQLNGWNFSEQSLKQVLREFSYVRPEISSNVQETLELAIQTLTEPTQSPPHIGSRCKFRLVLLLQHQPGFTGFEYQDGNNVIDVSEVVNYHISRSNKGGGPQNSVFVQHCELIVLRLTDPLSSSTTVPPAPPPKTVGKVLAHLHYIQPSLLFDAFSDLAQRQHSLGRIKVTGIPMRETLPDADRTYQDTVLLYDAGDLDPIKGYNGLGTTKKKEVVVKWKSNDRRTNPDTLPCKSAHRVTPQIVSTGSSLCLMKHVCAGNPVFLTTPSSDSDLVTHALLLQGPEVILHVLHSSTPSEGLPLHIFATSVDNYRVKEFVEIVDANILQPRPKSMKQPPPLERVQLNAKSNVSTVGTITHVNSTASNSTTTSSTPSDTSISASTGIDNATPLTASATITPTSTSTPTSNPISSTLPAADAEPPKLVTVLAPRNLERYPSLY